MQDPEFQDKVKEAFRCMLQCQVFVSKGEVYSPNEPLEEFSAERLRFVLVPYYLAELSQLVVDDKRAAHLLRAKENFKLFLDDLERLGLLVEADGKVWKRGGVAPKDGKQRVEEKQERARREMANKKRLREVRAKLDENEKAGVDSDKGIDEELFRESVLLTIQLAIKGALDGLDLIEQELPLVERMEQMKKLEQAKSSQWKAADADRNAQQQQDRPPPKPITVDLPPGYLQQVHSSGAITITKAPVVESSALQAAAGLQVQRTDFQRGVFRPGYNMATMSIEEAGEIDYQEMLQRQEREKRSAAEKEKEPDEDDTDHYDRVTVYKDRDWDKFKDDNPTGSGNTTGNLG